VVLDNLNLEIEEKSDTNPSTNEIEEKTTTEVQKKNK